MEPHRNAWPFLAVGLMAVLVLLFGWTVLSSGGASEAVLREAAEVAPDVRPKLPEMPKAPDAPIPVPK